MIAAQCSANRLHRTGDYGLGAWPWDSPKKSTDHTPYMVMMADVIEKGTANPNVTSAPHGRGGPVQSALGTLPEPEAIGACDTAAIRAQLAATP